jgi:hypothetical protein
VIEGISEGLMGKVFVEVGKKCPSDFAAVKPPGRNTMDNAAKFSRQRISRTRMMILEVREEDVFIQIKKY